MNAKRFIGRMIVFTVITVISIAVAPSITEKLTNFIYRKIIRKNQ